MRFAQLITLMTASLFGMAACAEQPDAEVHGPTQAVIAGKVVNLSNDQGRCKLAGSDTPDVILDMQWPCQFSITKHNQPRIEMFNETPILMVERGEHLPAPSRDCRTDLQAVRWYKGRLEAARAQRIAMCGPGQWDQKMFVASFRW